MHLTREDLEAVAAFVHHSPELTPAEAARKRAAAMQGPQEPSELEQRRLGEIEVAVASQAEGGTIPNWLREVCRYRDADACCRLRHSIPASWHRALNAVHLLSCYNRTTTCSRMSAGCQGFWPQQVLLPQRCTGGPRTIGRAPSRWGSMWMTVLSQTDARGLAVLPDCNMRGGRVLSEASPIAWSKFIDGATGRRVACSDDEEVDERARGEATC